MKLDLTGPAYTASKQDLANLSRQGTASREISVLILRAFIGAKFPQGMDGKDGRVWGRLMDQMVGDGKAALELSDDDFAWLHRIVTNDDLKLPPDLAGWRSALVDYMDTVRTNARKVAK